VKLVQTSQGGSSRIFNRRGADHLEYQPDFVAETANTLYMLKTKASNRMYDSIVLAKKEVAGKWRADATKYEKIHSEKPWRCLLISHDGADSDMTLTRLAERYGS